MGVEWGVVTLKVCRSAKDAFDSEVYTIARLRYPDLRKYQRASSDKVTALQQGAGRKGRYRNGALGHIKDDGRR